MAASIYDDHGIRFEYPHDWEVDVAEDGPRTSVTVQSAAGPAFAMVTADESCPDPKELANEALAALREEYPKLVASPAGETLDGHAAVGHDVEFVSLDMTNTCVIRCFGTPRRTVFILTQWSDLERDDPEDALEAIRKSLEETDS
jgi:hypothetical protein